MSHYLEFKSLTMPLHPIRSILILFLFAVLAGTEGHARSIEFESGGDCDITDIYMEYLECENGQFYIDFEFEYFGTSDSFILIGNGEEYGTFSYGELYYTVGPFDGTVETIYELIIIDSEDSFCSGFIEFSSIDCGITDCAVEGPELFDFYCDTDSTYSFLLAAEFIDPGNDFFDLWVNNEFYGFYAISELPISVEGITPRDVEYDIVQICVNDDPECCAVLEFLPPDCLEQSECSIEIIELFEFDCESDSSYQFYLAAEIIEPGNDFIEVWVNEQYQGYYLIEELPLAITGIIPMDIEWEFIEVCINDVADCCYSMSYQAPDCTINSLIDHTSSLDLLQTPDGIIVTGLETGQRYSAEIYDMQGRRISQSVIPSTGRIDTRALNAGVYQVIIGTDEQIVSSLQFIK
ncbi:MAG: T9SS type A sorting domain-containing protein [Flavobacteriales bacterium]|nr:T9SS type A sorting domain-containing protein [Flavobacteriales bacterium]